MGYNNLSIGHLYLNSRSKYKKIVLVCKAELKTNRYTRNLTEINLSCVFHGLNTSIHKNLKLIKTVIKINNKFWPWIFNKTPWDSKCSCSTFQFIWRLKGKTFPKISWYLTAQFDAVWRQNRQLQKQTYCRCNERFFVVIDYQTQNNPQAPVRHTHTHTQNKIEEN